MEEYKEWMDKSEQDLDTAKYNLDGEKYEAGIFFLQQAAEKSLKALYIKKFKKIFRTHDLVSLGKSLEAPDELLECCKKLTPAYYFTRYPDSSNVRDLESKSDELLNCAEDIIKWARKQI
jgi:HEPN domain-containing protein